MVSKMLPIVALVFVALAAAEEDPEFFFHARDRAFGGLGDGNNCSVCTIGTTKDIPCETPLSVGPGESFSATCGTTTISATCATGGYNMGPVSPTNTVKTVTGSALSLYVCPAHNEGAATVDATCQQYCNKSAANLNKLEPKSDAYCIRCNLTQKLTVTRGLKQAIILGGFLVAFNPCVDAAGNLLTGAALASCCNTAFINFCKANNGVRGDICVCGVQLLNACPSCSSKDSNKLLLLLLLLLLLIPALLCCLLLCCCLLRRKKKEQDTHFSTFDPQAAAPMPMPVCAPVPTACVAPGPTCFPPPPTSYAAPCAPVFDAGCGGAPLTTFGAPSCTGPVF